jgi:N-acetylneuraminic acid mutarotase
MKNSIHFIAAALFLCAGFLHAQQVKAFKNLADMEHDRYGMASVTDGEFIYVFGGGTYSLNGFLDNIERYDHTANKWQTIGEGLIQRSFQNAEYIQSENKIYIFNGEYFSNKNKNPSGKPLSMRNNKTNTEQLEDLMTPLKVADVNKTGFTDIIEVIDMNTGAVALLDSNPYPVLSAGTAVWNNKIYVFGGWNPKGFSDRLYEYNPAKNEWARLPDMPEAKQTTGKIVDGILYTFGGKDNTTPFFKTIHAYNIKEKKWEPVGELPKGIAAAASAADGKNIWLTGSLDNIYYLAVFDTRTKKTRVIESDMKGRKYAAAQVINNTLFVIGGVQTDETATSLKSLQGADCAALTGK